MKLHTFAIEAASTLLVDTSLWDSAKQLVADLETKPLSNEDKHQKVLDDLKELGFELASTFGDFIIKLAVLWLKSLSA